MARLSAEDRERIVALARAQLSHKSIAGIFGVTVAAVEAIAADTNSTNAGAGHSSGRAERPSTPSDPAGRSRLAADDEMRSAAHVCAKDCNSVPAAVPQVPPPALVPCAGIPVRESVDELAAHKRLATISRAQNTAGGVADRRENGRTFLGLRRFGCEQATPIATGGCQWIEGDPAPGQRMMDLPKCGAAREIGTSYCTHHNKRARSRSSGGDAA